MKVLEVGLYEVIESRRMFGILTGSGAIHAATCKAFGIADFERVSYLRIWKP